MEITVGNYSSDARLVEAVVRYQEIINDHAYSAQVNVWVPNVDSRAEIRKMAREESHKFLLRALSAHSAASQSQ